MSESALLTSGGSRKNGNVSFDCNFIVNLQCSLILTEDHLPPTEDRENLLFCLEQ